MPTYEYKCKSCGHSFDAFQNIKDEPLKVCPECGKELRRLINGGSGVIFKGGGFYVTDKNGKSCKKEPDAVSDGKTGTEQNKTSCPGCSKSETPACPLASGS